MADGQRGIASEAKGAEQPAEKPVLTAATLEAEAASQACGPLTDAFFQISPEIVALFPRFQFPVDLYRLNDAAQSLCRIYEAGRRLEQSSRSRLLDLCGQGLLFVSRGQREIYGSYLTGQLDFVLQDRNLSPRDAAQSLYRSLSARLVAFMARPEAATFAPLASDLDICLICLERDSSLVREFICTVHDKSLPQSKDLNAGLIALAILSTYSGGRLPGPEIAPAALGFLIHDVGMCRIPRFIVNKPTGLALSDRQRIRTHPQLALDIVKELKLDDPRLTAPILEHHERLDGSGYPKGLKAEAISILGRICAVGDAYAAMISDRPHAQGRRPIQAAAELVRDCRHFDRTASTALLSLLQDVTC